MRISRRSALAACLSMASLAVWAAGASPHAAAAVQAPADAVASQCQTVPAPAPAASASASASDSASPSPTAAAPSVTPADLCISVDSAQGSIQAGQNGSWTVTISADNGPVNGVTVTLTGIGGEALFTGGCPGGNGGESCVVGDLNTSVAPASYQLQAQIAVPSGAAGTSVTLSASANAIPELPATPAAAVAVGVTAPPAPASSSPAPASSSPAASKSASASASASAATTAPATSPTSPATTAVTPTISPQTIPGVTSIPTLTSPQGVVTAIANPGSIGSLLPTISPAADTLSPTSPTAGLQSANPASAAVAADRANATRSMFMMPTATAETLGIILLIIFLAMAARLRAVRKLFPRAQPDGPARGAHGKAAPPRRAGIALLSMRRRRGATPPPESPKNESPKNETPKNETPTGETPEKAEPEQGTKTEQSQGTEA